MRRVGSALLILILLALAAAYLIWNAPSPVLRHISVACEITDAAREAPKSSQFEVPESNTPKKLESVSPADTNDKKSDEPSKVSIDPQGAAWRVPAGLVLRFPVSAEPKEKLLAWTSAPAAGIELELHSYNGGCAVAVKSRIAGTYSVAITATDEQGNSDVRSFLVEVMAAPKFLDVPVYGKFALVVDRFSTMMTESEVAELLKAYSSLLDEIQEESEFDCAIDSLQAGGAPLYQWGFPQPATAGNKVNSRTWMEERLSERVDNEGLLELIKSVTQNYPADLDTLIVLVGRPLMVSSKKAELLKQLPTWMKKFQNCDLTIVQLGREPTASEFYSKLAEATKGRHLVRD